MNQILLISKSVKIHETLFSLPFAYFGCIYAQNGIIDWGVLFYVTIALGSARTFGMAINRYLDFNIEKYEIINKTDPINKGPFTESGGVVICLSDNSHITEIEASCSTGNDVSPLAQNQTFNF